jgi:hypothetical protein
MRPSTQRATPSANSYAVYLTSWSERQVSPSCPSPSCPSSTPNRSSASSARHSSTSLSSRQSAATLVSTSASARPVPTALISVAVPKPPRGDGGRGVSALAPALCSNSELPRNALDVSDTNSGRLDRTLRSATTAGNFPEHEPRLTSHPILPPDNLGTQIAPKDPLDLPLPIW